MRCALIAFAILLCLTMVGCGEKNVESVSAEPTFTPTSHEQPISEPVIAKQEEQVEQGRGEGEWGHLTGKFVITGERPAIPFEDVPPELLHLVGGKDRKVDDLVVDPDGGLRDVFVMMYLKGVDEVPVHPSYDAKMAEPVVIDMVKCRFEPHALFCRTGQVLRIQNSDDVGHNCHIVSFNNEHSCNLPVNNHVDWVDKLADRSPSPVVDDIYLWMNARILFREEPYVAISKADGTFTIENIPAGDWKFQFWHQKGASLRQLQVEDYDVGRRGEIAVTIADGETLDLGTMTIDSEHLNR